MKVIARAFRVAVVLWAGSLWSLLWVAAALFYFLSDRQVAGIIAGRLFSIETYLGIGVGALALLLPNRSRFRLGFLAVALLAVNEWILKRWMNLAQAHGTALGLRFGAWHGISALLYVLACLCVLVMIYKDEYRHA
ncbi:MAG TPA: DUF4149 domain-containing protein [Steroidobacteraceae bacterium]|nr:DUF4149 domain-containing protein [Steroidobacteraceae bacterium]